jgi:hypothetical protein
VVGEIFDMDLHPGPVSGEQVQGHAPFLPDHDGLVAIGCQRGLDDFLVRFFCVLDAHLQPLRGLARFDAPRAFPPAGEKACAVFTVESKVALDLAVPTGQTRGIGECRPHVVDIGIEPILHAQHALAIC